MCVLGVTISFTWITGTGLAVSPQNVYTLGQDQTKEYQSNEVVVNEVRTGLGCRNVKIC